MLRISETIRKSHVRLLWRLLNATDDAMAAASQGNAHIKLVTAGPEFVARDEPRQAAPAQDDLRTRLVAASGGRVLVFAPDPAVELAFAIDREPVRPAEILRHGETALGGINLLRDADLGSTDLPWRTSGGSDTRIGRDIAEQWTLRGGHTGYVSTRGDARATLVYRDGDSELVPVAPGRRYTCRGLFGLHRCRAVLRVDLLGPDAVLLATREHEIPRRAGGRNRADYSEATIAFETPRDGAFARLTVETRPTLPADTDAAHLFFTDLSLARPCLEPSLWRHVHLTPREAVAMTGTARLLEVRLPALGLHADATVSVQAREGGGDVAGSPARLPSSQDAFRLDAFDGITLAGCLATGPSRLTLLIDGAPAVSVDAGGDQEGGSTVSVRVPDAWLDGAPHLVELVASGSWRPLFAAAEILPALTESWATPDGAGRPVFAPETHALARLRYRSLAAHLDRSDAPVSAQAARCHAILCGRVRPGPDAHLTVPAVADPAVSILLHGAAEAQAAWRCVAGLLFAVCTTSFEVVLVDPSPAGLADLVAGIALPPQDGTGPDRLSRALARARGERVVLLDAAAEVSAGWLDELSDALARFDGAGAVGPKIVTSAGRLAGGGGMVWASGVPEALTFGGNPEDPRANYARPVDWLPATALMARTEDLRALAPALAERDVGAGDGLEISYGLAERGLRIVYAPHAVVAVAAPDPLHGDGGHSLRAPESSPGFRRRWVAAYRNNPPEGTPLASAIDRHGGGRVLFLDLQVPRPDIDAGSYAADQEIRLFQALGFKVTFLAINLQSLGRYAQTLQRRGVEILYAPFAESVEDALARRADAFDLVYMTRYNVARVALPFLRRHQPRAKRILNVADLHFLRELRAGLADRSAEAVNRSRVTRDTELALMREVDLTLTYSDVEATVILSHHLDKAKVGRLPWVVAEAPGSTSFAERRDLAFVGSFGHRPNVDAMVAFVRDVMPLVRARLPGVSLHIFGSQMVTAVEQLAAPDVLVRGHAADLDAVFGPARVFVAPLGSGAGLKGKVLAAMAHGCPTILSDIAAEGIGGRDGTDYRLANRPAEWADAIVSLYEDERAWSGVAASARDLVRTRYGFDGGVATLRRALEAIDVFAAPVPRAFCPR